jgi:hypothetical protein
MGQWHDGGADLIHSVTSKNIHLLADMAVRLHCSMLSENYQLSIDISK